MSGLSINSGSAIATGISTSDSIETIFFKATSPINKSADPNLINLFCSKVNEEVEGHHQAIRLISHKIQSPQEHEALRTLELLDVATQKCGKRFQQEIGKFRFLNEMIKLVSPKYLANHTSDKVKKKVIELFFCWTKDFPHETKIIEAYQMLRKQSIIVEDPIYAHKSVQTPVVPTRPKSIFDQDEEKKKTLERLLKSRRPEDLEQANALIKSFVKKDEEKIEKLSNRAQELEKIQNNVRLLSDMLIHFNSTTISDGEKETMEYLHDELEKFRPILFRLATESEDGDESLGEILSLSDSLSKVLSEYDRLIRSDHLFKDDAVLPIFDDLPVTGATSSRSTLIDFDHEKEKNSKNDLDDLFGSIQLEKSSSNLDDVLPLFSPSTTSTSTSISSNSQMTKPVDEHQQKKKGGLFDDLQDLLVDPSTGQKISSTKSSFENRPVNPTKVALNDLLISSSNSSLSSRMEIPSMNIQSFRPSVKHRSIELKLTNSNGLNCQIHIGRDSPRSDLIPLVLTMTNTNVDSAIKHLHFDLSISKSKSLRFKLEKASGDELAPFNPIFPSSSITQMIVLSNPDKEPIELICRLNYSINGEDFVETTTIDRGIPSTID